LRERVEHPRIEQDPELIELQVEPPSGPDAAVQLAPQFEHGVIVAWGAHLDRR
jgi:hypothetical protein